MQELTYLDDKPVFEDERRFSEAFYRGGIEEERRERTKYKQEKLDADNKRLQDFRDLVETWKPEKKLKEEEKKRSEEKMKMMDKCLKLKNEKKKQTKDEGKKLLIEEDTIDEETEVNTKTISSTMEDKPKTKDTVTISTGEDILEKENSANPTLQKIIQEEDGKIEKRPFVKDNKIFDEEDIGDMPELEHVSKEEINPETVEDLIKSVEKEAEIANTKDNILNCTSISLIASQEAKFTNKIEIQQEENLQTL